MPMNATASECTARIAAGGSVCQLGRPGSDNARTAFAPRFEWCVMESENCGRANQSYPNAAQAFESDHAMGRVRRVYWCIALHGASSQATLQEHL